ncbi:MAG TPA: hypothetical protein VJV05_01745 [Pyrinomonadaceae bacterium]|nr:hypothetical protein [Pyrinomonadaceae bacterium]
MVERWKAERDALNEECRRIQGAARVEYLRLDFERRWFGLFERLLHEETGPLWLKNPLIARVVADSLHFHDGRSYDLHAYSLMANHGHVLFTPFLNEQSLTEIRDPILRYESNAPTLGAIMRSFKGYTAREANKILGRSGQFWDAESYDHEVRNGIAFRRIEKYILNNPVKAGLVRDWRDWKWNWVAAE